MITDAITPTLEAGIWGDYYLPGDHRKITTFPSPAQTTVLLEENVGLVPNDCGQSYPAPKINNAYFSWANPGDVVEPRHLEASTAGCLDGHVILINCGIPTACQTTPYTYRQNGPKQIHRMPEYCPFSGMEWVLNKTNRFNMPKANILLLANNGI